MKKGRGFVVFVERGAWKIGNLSDAVGPLRSVTVSSGPTPVESATQAAEAFKSLDAAGNDVIVALPAQACLCATLSSDDLPRRGSRSALLYRLEEKLPIAAEDIAADFIAYDDKALGICARNQDVDPILQSLDAAGMRVAAICPGAMLALQGALAPGCDKRLLTSDVLIWQSGSVVNLFTMESARPIAWVTLPAQPADIALSLGAWAISHGKAIRLGLVNVDDRLAAEIASMADVHVECKVVLSDMDAAMNAARQIIAGREKSYVDLRTGDASGGTYQRQQLHAPLMGTAVTAVVLACILIGAMLYRASRYSQLATRADADREAIFRHLFPGQPVPVGIESRLLSAEHQLRPSGRGAAPAGSDPLVLLQEVLTNLPTGVRYKITDVDLEADHLTLQGEVSSHPDADAVASGLRRSMKLNVDSPQTQQLASGVVQFSIAAASRTKPSARRIP